MKKIPILTKQEHKEAITKIFGDYHIKSYKFYIETTDKIKE